LKKYCRYLDRLRHRLFYGHDAVVRGNDLSRFCDRGQRGTTFNCQEGLTISDVTRFDVDGNIVHDALQLNAPGGQQRQPGGGEGIDVKGSSRDGVVRNNRVYKLNQLGIYIDGFAKAVENVQVYNNIVEGNSLSQIAARDSVNRAQLAIDRNLMFPFARIGVRELAGSNGITSSASFIDAANKNFRLNAGSPALGASFGSSPRPKDDLDGKARATTGGLDLGAYAR
jgi:hypothetical protein